MLLSYNLLQVDCRLISIPGDFRYKWHKEEEKDSAYNFKRRYLKARKIPSLCVTEDRTGGFLVLSKKRRSRFSNEVDKYGVYKTKDGVWICTCMDFSHFLKPCKHIIKVILYLNGIPEEKNKLDDLIRRAIYSEKRMVEYKDDEYLV